MSVQQVTPEQYGLSVQEVCGGRVVSEKVSGHTIMHTTTF